MTGQLDQILADMPKRAALAELLGICDGLCETALLGGSMAAILREATAKVEVTFNFRFNREPRE